MTEITRFAPSTARVRSSTRRCSLLNCNFRDPRRPKSLKILSTF